jgi:hypothetical protein
VQRSCQSRTNQHRYNSGREKHPIHARSPSLQVHPRLLHLILRSLPMTGEHILAGLADLTSILLQTHEKR